MFTKAKYAEYQITPNLMHAHAMHLRQSYYETRHYDSTTLEELHYRVKHLSCRILRYCVTRERIYDKRRDSQALDELGAKTPINQLFEELQDIHEEYEAEYKRLNMPDARSPQMARRIHTNPPTPKHPRPATKSRHHLFLVEPASHERS